MYKYSVVTDEKSIEGKGRTGVGMIARLLGLEILFPSESQLCLGMIAAVCSIFTLALLVPNIFIFSVDDIQIIAHQNSLAYIADNQAPNGRFSLSLFSHLLSRWGFSRIDFQALGAVALVIGAQSVFSATIRFAAGIISPVVYVLGFCAFISFGLLMDNYSFASDWLVYGVAFAGAGTALSICASTGTIGLKIVLSSVIGGVAMGFYQTYPSIVAYSILASLLVRFLRDERLDRLTIAQYCAVSASVLGAIFFYFIVNHALHFAGVAGYESLARPFGMRFIHQNFHQYLKTMREALNAFKGPYSVYLSGISMVLSLGSVLAAIVSLRSWYAAVGFCLVFFAVAVILPNPANILLQTYWPSPRSISPVAIFFPLLIIYSLTYFRWPRLANYCLEIVLALVVFAQVLVYFNQQKVRMDQQTADFALADTLITMAYQNTSAGVMPVVKIRQGLFTTFTSSPRSFEFGVSLFATNWSLGGLFAYLSNHKVVVEFASADDCAQTTKGLDIFKKGDSLLVCRNN